ELFAGRLLRATSPDASPCLGWPHASTVAVRHLCAHAVSSRDAAFREQLRDARRADSVAECGPRMVGTRTARLDALCPDTALVEGYAGHQGRTRSGRCAHG